ncbi:hypothetical protein [Actinoplanes sp. CA-252034]|uniref:hypothetical protein n=1 Tax=Actinoplanes sp. CA-252034 TaxID=3239906 RepID=UPI003D989063
MAGEVAVRLGAGPVGRIEVVFCAVNGTMVPFSAGARASDERMLQKAQESMSVGATGLIFGRNVRNESLRFVAPPAAGPREVSDAVRRLP